jgi:hypothetical protein
MYSLIRQSMARSATPGKRPTAPATPSSATSALGSASLRTIASLSPSNNGQEIREKISQYDTRMKDIEDKIGVLEEQCKILAEGRGRFSKQLEQLDTCENTHVNEPSNRKDSKKGINHTRQTSDCSSAPLYPKTLHYKVLPKPSDPKQALFEVMSHIQKNHPDDKGIVYCASEKVRARFRCACYIFSYGIWDRIWMMWLLVSNSSVITRFAQGCTIKALMSLLKRCCTASGERAR